MYRRKKLTWFFFLVNKIIALISWGLFNIINRASKCCQKSESVQANDDI